MNTQQQLSAAEVLPLFQDLTGQDKKDLITAGRIRTIAKGDLLFMHGQDLRSFYIVIDGAIRQHRETPEGKQITVELAVRGDMVGASHIFESFSTYQWSATAAEESIVLEYPIFWFKEKVKCHGSLALNMLAALSQQTHFAAIDAEHLVTFSAAQRVSCFLLRLCTLYDMNPQQFTLPYSKTTIASKLGMELETFSRSLNKLKDMGITVKGAQVSIEDIEALEESACGFCSISEDCATLRKLNGGMCPAENMVSKFKIH